MGGPALLLIASSRLGGAAELLLDCRVLKRVPVLDGFRAYAILGVVGLHLLLLSRVAQPGSHAGLLAWGVLGNIIDTFFIISGFVIFLPVVRRAGELGSIRGFATGRVARLVPAYWLSLLVVLVLLVVVPNQPDLRFVHRLPEILADMAALQMPIRLFDGTFQVGLGINGALWMISVIVGFYFVFPFIARSYFRHPLAGLAIAAAITLIWKEAVLHLPGLWASLDSSSEEAWVSQLVATDELPGWAFSFALGMTGAWAWVRFTAAGDPDRLQRPAAVGAALSLIACGICAYFYGKHASNADTGIIGGSTARENPWLTMPFSAARAALMASIVLAPVWLQRPFDNAPVRRLAELSYGVYLIHLVIAWYVCLVWLDLPRDGTPVSALAWFGVVIPASIAYAYLSRRLVEIPARRWILSRSRREARAAAPPRLRHSDA
jgi:peptidoglycan/LPS O-acetylase OafA/YrhL